MHRKEWEWEEAGELNLGDRDWWCVMPYNTVGGSFHALVFFLFFFFGSPPSSSSSSSNTRERVTYLFSRKHGHKRTHTGSLARTHAHTHVYTHTQVEKLKKQKTLWITVISAMLSRQTLLSLILILGIRGVGGAGGGGEGVVVVGMKARTVVDSKEAGYTIVHNKRWNLWSVNSSSSQQHRIPNSLSLSLPSA